MHIRIYDLCGVYFDFAVNIEICYTSVRNFLYSLKCYPNLDNIIEWVYFANTLYNVHRVNENGIEKLRNTSKWFYTYKEHQFNFADSFFFFWCYAEFELVVEKYNNSSKWKNRFMGYIGCICVYGY